MESQEITMTPGELAFRRACPDGDWSALSADEQAAWNLGASLTPVGAVLRLVQDENRKER